MLKSPVGAFSLNLLIEYSVSLSVFFQAEDGIRDADVTGVQTCALPILALDMPTAVTPVPEGSAAAASSWPVPGAATLDQAEPFQCTMSGLVVGKASSTPPTEPTAHTSWGETVTTPHRALPFGSVPGLGLRTTVHWWPSQCSIRVRGRSPSATLPYQPTAHTFAAAPLTDTSQAWSSFRPGSSLGLATTAQAWPLKCIVSGDSALLAAQRRPTAHTLFGAMAVTLRSHPLNGRLVAVQVWPSKCSIRPGPGKPSVPTAQMLAGPAAATPDKVPGNEALRTIDHFVPSQCSTRLRYGSMTLGPPTAHTFLAETAAIPNRELSSGGARFGLGVCVQLLPVECSASVWKV